MISKTELDKAIEIARKYKVGKLFLIGSSLNKEPDDINDYDFAVLDVPSGFFFEFYGELFRTMSRNVDLIDISGKSTKFKKIVIKEGKLIYDKTAA
ncbi:MAG: nucleotidyltransferase domain-containing protein [Bacteroidetes bacterium]|nr:nucleotidyltransferase domain-containing protein [Bacteroidota bacterium]